MKRESAQIALWKAVKCVGVPTSVRNARKDWWKPMDNVHVLLEEGEKINPEGECEPCQVLGC